MGLSLMEARPTCSDLARLPGQLDRAGAARPPAGGDPAALAHGNVADPVLQNFCLTAIVIGVAVTGVFLTVTVRSSSTTGRSTRTAARAARLSDALLAALAARLP